jgi:hypothetical protein
MKRKSDKTPVSAAVRILQGRSHELIFGEFGPREGLKIAHESLVEWLNGVDANREWSAENHTAESQKRIVELLNAVKDVLATDLSIYESSLVIPLNIPRLTRPYASYPTVVFNAEGKRWATVQQPISTYRYPWDTFDSSERDIADHPYKAKYPYGEVKAAHAIFELAEVGVLDRIRQCECGSWFFARTTGQISCSSRCRQKRYESTEKFKKKRCEYLKKRYHNFVKGGKAKITPQTKKRRLVGKLEEQVT